MRSRVPGAGLAAQDPVRAPARRAPPRAGHAARRAWPRRMPDAGGSWASPPRRVWASPGSLPSSFGAARRSGHLVAFGECQSFGTNTAYFVFQEIWRRLFVLEDGDPERSPDRPGRGTARPDRPGAGRRGRRCSVRCSACRSPRPSSPHPSTPSSARPRSRTSWPAASRRGRGTSRWSSSSRTATGSTSCRSTCSALARPAAPEASACCSCWPIGRRRRRAAASGWTSCRSSTRSRSTGWTREDAAEVVRSKLEQVLGPRRRRSRTSWLALVTERAERQSAVHRGADQLHRRPRASTSRTPPRLRTSSCRRASTRSS